MSRPPMPWLVLVPLLELLPLAVVVVLVWLLGDNDEEDGEEAEEAVVEEVAVTSSSSSLFVEVLRKENDAIGLVASRTPISARSSGMMRAPKALCFAINIARTWKRECKK